MELRSELDHVTLVLDSGRQGIFLDFLFQSATKIILFSSALICFGREGAFGFLISFLFHDLELVLRMTYAAQIDMIGRKANSSHNLLRYILVYMYVYTVYACS